MKNHVSLIGRIVGDIETRDTANGSVTNFSFVTDRPKLEEGKPVKNAAGYKDTNAEFHRITVFNGAGKAIAKHKTKNDKLSIDSRLHYSKWQDQTGNDRYSVEIIASEVHFL
jgi:single-strand DNA-binding protein